MASRLPDQGRGDGADVAREQRANARVDGVAQSLDECIGAHARAWRHRRVDDLDGAVHEAGGADALEIKVARKVIAARPKRLQRRIELCFGLNERAGRRCHAAADRKPYALRLVGNPRSLDTLYTQHEAVGLLTLLAQLDKARKRDAVGRIARYYGPTALGP